MYLDKFLLQIKLWPLVAKKSAVLSHQDLHLGKGWKMNMPEIKGKIYCFKKNGKSLNLRDRELGSMIARYDILFLAFSITVGKN